MYIINPPISPWVGGGPGGKSEFDHLLTTIDIGRYVGKWIAVVDEQLFSGDSRCEVFRKAKDKYPDRDPLVMKVPTETVMLL